MKLTAIEPSDTGRDLGTLSALLKGPAADHRKHRDRRVVRAEATVMYRREKCLVHASICREKAQADPARSDHWIDRAIVWH